MPKYRFEDIAFNSTAKKKPVEEDKYSYIGLEHLDPGSLTVSRWGADVAPIGDKLLMKKGDVLFGRRRAYQRKVAIAPFDGIFSAHGMVLRPNEKVISKEFFPLFISSDYFLDEAIRISVGSLSPTVNWKDLKKLEFDIPSLEEQKNIAPLVWAAIDTKNAYKQLINATDEMIKAKFTEQFNKCKRDKLGNYIEQVRGVSYKPKDLGNELDDDHIILLRANNVSGGKINLEEIQYVSKDRVNTTQILQKGDILMCASSGSLDQVGKASLYELSGEYTFGAFCKVLRPSGILSPEYIASYMQGIEYRNIIKGLAQGSNINNLRNEHINNMMVPIPTAKEQETFIAFLHQADASIVSLENAISKIDMLIKSLIQ